MAARSSAFAAQVVYAGGAADRASTLAAFLVYAGPRARIVRDSTLAADVVYAVEPFALPQNSTFAAYVVWAPGESGAARTRAWTYTLDGHTFYVLDLGAEGAHRGGRAQHVVPFEKAFDLRHPGRQRAQDQ